MDFTLTDEQELLAATASSLFAGECGSEFVRAAMEQPKAAAPLWDDHLADWMELASGDVVDLSIFMQEHGRAVAPGAFFPSVLATQFMAAQGRTLEGTGTVAIAGADGIWLPNPQTVKHYVVSADLVDSVVVINGTSAAPTAALIAAPELAAREVEQMDMLRRVFEVDVAEVRPGPAIDSDALQQAIDRCLVIVSAELIGVGRWLLDASVAYAKERVQFDRPIGSFQGLQWMLVDMALDLERAAAAVSYAAMCVDAGDPDRHRAVHGAKAEAGLAARHCAKTGLQVHGGIGYTYDHDLHLRLRRAYAGDAFMGPSSHHLDRLAALLLD
jgi:hypothetical protein